MDEVPRIGTGNLTKEYYQHRPDRWGRASGYKPKTVKTRLGELSLNISKVRKGGFYPEALEKGQRSD